MRHRLNKANDASSVVGGGLNGGYDGMMAEVLTADCILSQDDLLAKKSSFTAIFEQAFWTSTSL